jgi:hypothetical protein
MGMTQMTRTMARISGKRTTMRKRTATTKRMAMMRTTTTKAQQTRTMTG